MEAPAHGNIEMDLLQKKLFLYEIALRWGKQSGNPKQNGNASITFSFIVLNKNISVWEQMTNGFFPILNLIWQPTNLLVQGWFLKNSWCKMLPYVPGNTACVSIATSSHVLNLSAST